MPRVLAVSLAILLGSPIGSADAEPDERLASIKARGSLACGLAAQGIGQAQRDEDGRWQGFDVSFCRALATALFGDPEAVTFVPLQGDAALPALKADEVDLIARMPDPGLSANREGLALAATSLHDGLGFLARKDLDAIDARELDGARICVPDDGRGRRLLDGFFKRARIAPTLLGVADQDSGWADYRSGKCDVLTGKSLALASMRPTLEDPASHRVLPDILTKEPSGPLTGNTDPRWLEVVRWTLFALLIAEELGVDSENAPAMRGAAGTPEAWRLLGREGRIGADLGLTEDWAFQVLRANGNYAQIFDRTLGPDSPLGLERGINALWRDGGLMHAPPLQ